VIEFLDGFLLGDTDLLDLSYILDYLPDPTPHFLVRLTLDPFNILIQLKYFLAELKYK